MAEIIIMPKLGFNMDEGKLVEWYKNEGDAVKKGEPLFSVETDKTNMDIEATGDGIVSALLIQAGDKIPVTLPIAVIGAEGEDVSQAIKDAKAQLAAGGGAPAEEAAPAEAKQAAAEPAEKAAKTEASASPKSGDRTPFDQPESAAGRQGKRPVPGRHRYRRHWLGRRHL